MKARENPFRVERVHALRYRFARGTMDDLLDRFAKQNFRGAIVGPHGSGKTTLLEELQTELSSQGHLTRQIRFTEANTTVRGRLLDGWLRGAPQNAMLILDGAEQLTASEWRTVRDASRTFRGLVVTTHRPGLLPTLYTCQTDELLLAELIAELTGEQGSVAIPHSAALLRRHAGNIRDCLRELYDARME